MLYFTSDNHFGDYATFECDRRPFKSVKKCDKYMIKQLNKACQKDDTIYFVGDFFDCDGVQYTSWRDIAAKYVKKIKAQKILIIGNNEERIIKYFFNGNFDAFKQWCLNLGFIDVLQNATVTFNGKEYYLVHRPSQFKAGVENLFGHTHKFSGIYKSFGINVSTNIYDFKPLTQKDVEELIALKNQYVDNLDNKIW